MSDKVQLWFLIAILVLACVGSMWIGLKLDKLDFFWAALWLLILAAPVIIVIFYAHLTGVKIDDIYTSGIEEREKHARVEFLRQRTKGVRWGLLMAAGVVFLFPLFLEFPSNSSGRALATIEDGELAYHPIVYQYPFDGVEVINTSLTLVCSETSVEQNGRDSEGNLGRVVVNMDVTVISHNRYYVGPKKVWPRPSSYCTDLRKKIYGLLVDADDVRSLVVSENKRVPSIETLILKELQEALAESGLGISVRAIFDNDPAWNRA